MLVLSITVAALAGYIGGFIGCYRYHNKVSEKAIVNVNTASLDELMTLPAVGETIAKRIIVNRPYLEKQDLLKVEGIGHKTFEKILEFIEV